MHGNTELAIVVLQAILPWLLSLCKILRHCFFLPEILMIKESCNLIGQEYILVCNLKLCKLTFRSELFFPGNDSKTIQRDP